MLVISVVPFHIFHIHRYNVLQSLFHHSCNLESLVALFYVYSHLRYTLTLTVRLPFFSSMKGINMYFGVFKQTFGLYSYKCLPVSDASRGGYLLFIQCTLLMYILWWIKMLSCIHVYMVQSKI